MSKVLLLTGPGGSGKTTVSTLMEQRGAFVRVDGDREDTEFFPNGNQWLPENSTLLQKAHKKILRKVKTLVRQGKNVVIDYIIFGRYFEFLDMFQKEFRDDFKVMILFPSINVLIKRDKERECWTTGKERIAAVHEEFASLKGDIGAEHYLDTSHQALQETYLILLGLVSHSS